MSQQVKDILPTGVLVAGCQYPGDVHAVRVLRWKEKRAFSKVMDNTRNLRKLFINKIIVASQSLHKFYSPQVEKAASTLGPI